MFLHVLLCNLYVNISFKKLQHTYIIILMPERNLINSLTLCFFNFKITFKKQFHSIQEFLFSQISQTILPIQSFTRFWFPALLNSVSLVFRFMSRSFRSFAD